MKKTVIVIIVCLVVAGAAYAQADSLNVRFVGSWEEAPYDLQSIFVQDSYAYVIDGQSLWVIDVSDPSNPVDVGCYKDTSSPAFCVHVQGQYAYVGRVNGLHVIDVSTPSAPQEVGHCEGFAFWSVYVVEEYAYVVQYDSEGLLYVIDVSDPSDPKQVGSYGSMSYPSDVHVKDSYAYVVGYGLNVIDVSEPTNSEKVGYSDVGGDIAYVFVSGNHAYVSYSEGFGGSLCVLDISTPSNPQEVDTLYEDAFSEVFVSDSYAYIRCSPFMGQGDHGLRVLDASDPTDLQEVGYHEGANGVFISVSGPYIYLAGSEGGLRIYENLLWESIEEEPEPSAIPIQLTPSLNRLAYDLPGQAQLSLYSADGRKVLERTIDGKGTWDAPAELPQGVYFARVVTENHTARSKVVVVR